MSLRWPVRTLAALMALAGIYPASYQLCPSWDVLVVRPSGVSLAGPVQDIRVRRSCTDYSVDGSGYEDDAITDDRGRAAFKELRTRESSIHRWFGNVSQAAMGGVHASFGRHASVFAFGDGMQGDAVSPDRNIEDWTGSPEHMTSRIVVGPIPLLTK